jgi:hypothetical protein
MDYVQLHCFMSLNYIYLYIYIYIFFLFCYSREQDSHLYINVHNVVQALFLQHSTLYS